MIAFIIMGVLSFGDMQRDELDDECQKVLHDVNVSRAIVLRSQLLALYRRNDENSSLLGVSLADLDDFQAYVSDGVYTLSQNVDVELFAAFKDVNESRLSDDEALSSDPTSDDGNVSFAMSEYFNELFRNEPYLYQDYESYMIVRGGYALNKENGARILHQIRFSLSLPRTENAFMLFMKDPLESDNETSDEEEQRDAEVGARYVTPQKIKGLKTYAAAGLRGIGNPFVQIRASYSYNVYDWLIRPVQYLEYSAKRLWYEQSELYFDRRISRQEMVRLHLIRWTQMRLIGMRYTTLVSYFNTLRFQKGFRTYAAVTGETRLNQERYLNVRYDDVKAQAGVYQYSIGGSWKAQWLRDWLFYEIEPRIEFDRMHNFRPNYVGRFWVELFFGDL